MICTTLERTSSPVALSTTRSCGLRRKALYDDPNDGATIQQVLTMRGIVEAAGEVTPGAMGHLVLPIPPLIAAGHVVDCPTVGDESRRAVHTVVTPEFLYRKRSALHSHLNSALLLAKGEAGDKPGLPLVGYVPISGTSTRRERCHHAARNGQTAPRQGTRRTTTRARSPR